MLASSLLNETHGGSLQGLSLLPAKVCPQDQPCLLRQLPRGVSDHMESHIPGDVQTCQRACLHGSQLDWDWAVGKWQKAALTLCAAARCF